MLQNSILFLVLIPICFGSIVVLKKLFGKAGLFAWVAIASIVSNITAASVGPMLGIPWDATLANISFATVLVANQILTLCYGEEEGKKGVYIGLFASSIFVLVMFIFAQIQPGKSDPGVSPLITSLFGFKDEGLYLLCNTVASILMAYLANLIDVKLVNKLAEKIQKNKWIASLVCGICNCVENFGFVILGLYLLPNACHLIPGAIADYLLMSFEACILVALTTCIFEIPLALLNNPVICLAKKFKNKEEIECK